MSVEVRIVDDPMAACAAELATALQAGGPVVLTGGSTAASYQSVSDWSGQQLWFSDERCVPASDARSNYGAVLAALGSRLDEADCERIFGELGPEQAATRYEEALSSRAQSGFELFLIGLGPDAHICSMFPGQASLDERSRLVVGVPEAGLEPFVSRVTLTFPAIALARKVVVMAAGAAKADALSAAFAEDAPVTREVPASLLSEYCDNILVLTDDAGAVRL
jgi:6-phosphogluconolactonase